MHNPQQYKDRRTKWPKDVSERWQQFSCNFQQRVDSLNLELFVTFTGSEGI